jgi:hypothetical protein
MLIPTDCCLSSWEFYSVTTFSSLDLSIRSIYLILVNNLMHLFIYYFIFYLYRQSCNRLLFACIIIVECSKFRSTKLVFIFCPCECYLIYSCNHLFSVASWFVWLGFANGNACTIQCSGDLVNLCRWQVHVNQNLESSRHFMPISFPLLPLNLTRSN